MPLTAAAKLGLEKLLQVWNTETEKSGAVEGFTLVSCCQNLDLLLWMVEAEEVIERKGRRTSYKTQL